MLSKYLYQFIVPLIITISFILVGTIWFITETGEDVTCTRQLVKQLGENNGYIEIQLRKQDPIEPVFDSEIQLLSTHPDDRNISKVTIIRSAVLSYARSIYTFPMFLDQGSIHFPQWEQFDLIAAKGLHAYFPFDSPDFNFQLSVDPPIHYEYIRITNRVPGFKIDCKSINSNLVDNNTIQIVFSITRYRLTQLFVIALLLSFLIFMIAIINLEKVESLTIGSASFFFSMWSIRKILEPEIHTFPTLFDIWILILCVIILIFLCYRLIQHYRARTNARGT